MGRRGHRKKLAVGIYEDATGRSVVVCGKEKRFPPFTPMRELRDYQDKEKRKRRRRRVTYGTLEDGVARWEPLERHLGSWMERRAELRAWCALYGPRPMRSLTPDDVRYAMGIWTQAGLTPKTIRNRLWSLKHLYVVLYGPDVETPVDYVSPPPKVRHVITPIDVTTVLKVYEKLLEFEEQGVLHNAKTRARFMVRAATGRRPSEIMRAKPEDVDLAQRVWRVRDGKGGWSEGLYLNEDMVAAWRVFIDAEAWGEFRTEAHAKMLRKAGWPTGIRPYNLRHSIGIGLSEMGHDLDDIGGWLGHKPGSRMTREHYVPILNSRMQRLSESLNGRFNGWTVPSEVPRTHLAQSGKPLRNKDRRKRGAKGESR